MRMLVDSWTLLDGRVCTQIIASEPDALGVDGAMRLVYRVEFSLPGHLDTTRDQVWWTLRTLLQLWGNGEGAAEAP